MSYHATEAILDEIAASGPQSTLSLTMRVLDQCVPAPADKYAATVTAIQALYLAGLVECVDVEDIVYDLTDYGWDVLTRLSHRPQRSATSIITTVHIDGVPLCFELQWDSCFIWYAGSATPTELTLNAALEKHAALEAQLIAQGIIKRA